MSTDLAELFSLQKKSVKICKIIMLLLTSFYGFGVQHNEVATLLKDAGFEINSIKNTIKTMKRKQSRFSKRRGNLPSFRKICYQLKRASPI